MRNRFDVCATLLAVALGIPAPAADLTGQAEAWEALKGLSGTWSRTSGGREDARPDVISYHVTSGGSVVFEEFVGETPGGVRNMATAYHFDEEQLVATHYCGAGNQPRMRAASYDPEARELRFGFWDVTHLPDPDAYYTTDIVLVFEDDDNAELRFRGRTAGQTGEWQVHRLRRLTRRPSAREDRASEP